MSSRRSRRGGNGDGEDVEAVIEVRAELLLGGEGAQVAIGGGDQAEFRGQGARVAEALELAVLEDAQELGLELERQVGDFIEEQRAFVSQLDAAQALVEGSGEGAFFVAEHFAFEQTGGNGRAVEFHEGALAAPAELMKGAGDQFLAGAGFALDQDGGIGGRGGLDLLQHVAQRGAGADDFAKAVLAADFFFEVHLFALDALAQGVDLLESQGVFDGDGDVPGHVLHELAVFGGVGVDFARGEHHAAQALAHGRERNPQTAAKLVALHVLHQVGPEAILGGGVRHIERLLGFPGELGRPSFERIILADGRIDHGFASDGFNADTTGMLVDQHEQQEVEADQFSERVPQAAEQGVAIARAQKGFRDLGEGAVLEGAVVGGHARALVSILSRDEICDVPSE